MLLGLVSLGIGAEGKKSNKKYVELKEFFSTRG